jgi:hypothetical protein
MNYPAASYGVSPKGWGIKHLPASGGIKMEVN